MTNERYVVLFNAEPGAGPALRATINELRDTRVVAEVSDHSALTDALRRMPANVLLVNLDPDVPRQVAMIEAVVAQFPTVPVIAISEHSTPQDIIAAMRAGCQQFVFKPIDRGDLRRALDRVATKQTQLAPGGHRICVMGGSGGVGTTTIACNLAMEIASITQTTCALVDLQLEFGDIASNFDCAASHTIANLCQCDGEVDRAMLETAVVRLPCRVAVLARPATVEEAALVTPDRAATILRLMSNYYGSVVVDTPRTFDRLTLGALEQADSVLLILQLVVPSVRNTLRLYEALLSYGMPDDRVHIVANRYKKNVGRLAPEDVEKQFNRKLLGIVPNDYEQVTSSLDYGHPLMADAPNSSVRAAIRGLAMQLLGESAKPAAGTERKAGLLGRLFGS